MSLEGMIREAERSLGLREPNHIQDWYASRNGSAFRYNFAWCNAAITYWAVKAGEHQSVCFGTDYAYTVWHADRFRKAGQWTTDIKGIRRGDIVFFDWGGSNTIGRIDHVGIVTGIKGGAVYTIEGNTNNVCARRVRYASTIVGYGRPKYKTSAPAGGSATYTVKSGDTLSAIARGYSGVTWQQIAQANGIKSPYRIYPGQKLTIPGKASTPSKPTIDLSKLVAAARNDPPKRGTPVSYAGTKTVENALVKEGLLAKTYADGHFGSATVAAYAAWQRRLGYSGRDADGIPGMTSLKKLGSKYGFNVVA